MEEFSERKRFLARITKAGNSVGKIISMKAIKEAVLTGTIIVSAIILAAPFAGLAQNDLDFNAVSANVEGAIRLSWNSASNEIYEIDEADSLIDTNTGTITWNVLYEDYPSQGTNTFWLDTGNYFADPIIVHPSQSPARFYRIVITGTNTTPTVPLVSIATNGISNDGSLTVTVTASTDQAFLDTKLYVDGQEMNEADDTTNWVDDSSLTNFVQDTYVLNTCEWPNGPHTLFATARCQTGAEGTHSVSAVGVGYSVSSFLPVTFSNLITRISFTQPFFAPEDGETQQVSAIFTANVNWTLQIQDVNTNSVRTVTGSGGSMLFNWDGTDDGSNDVPVGNYTYLITAETNGLALPLGSGGSSGGGGSPPSPSFASAGVGDNSDASQLWAISPNGGGNPVPFSLYPPGIDTNDFTFFEEPVGWNPFDSFESSGSSFATMDASSGASPDASGPSAQASRAPKRPPINPVKGRAGVYGVAYQTYSAQGTNGFSVGPPPNGILTQKVGLEGLSAGLSTFGYPPLPTYKRESSGFVQAMKKGNWSQGFAKVDDKLKITDLQGAGSPYNTVKLGLLMLHGTYGTSQDFTSGAGGCKQMYFPITSGHSAQYVRMSDMNLGNTASSGLKWFAIAACNSLFHTDWANMQSMGVKPYNSGLHLFLGTDTVVWTDAHIMEKWAQYMTKGKGTNAPMQITDAWINAAKDAYKQTGFNYTNAMKFAYAGDTSCTSDTLSSTNTPGGTWTYSSQQVWPFVP